MSIVITPNETKLIQAFQARQIPVITENLDIGDIHIRDSDGKIAYVIERKANNDLDASIKDGRYREQKSRLIESGISRKNIIYLIENLSKPKDQQTHKRIWSAISNTQHRDGLTVFQTKNIDQTVDYIFSLSSSVNNFIAIQDSIPDSSVNLNIKKRNVESKEWFKYSLTLIPKCSNNIASIVTEKFPTISSLHSEIQQNGINCLENLKHGNTQRRIGTKLSNSICNFILDNF